MNIEQELNESWTGILTLSLLAGLLAIPGKVDAGDIKKAGNNKAKIEQIVNADETNVDISIVARTLWAEAKGEGEEGIKAVMSVIWNRAGGDPSKFKDICLKHNSKGIFQFSCWKLTDVTNKVLIPSDVRKNNMKVWDICKKVAADAYAKKFSSTVGKSNIYYAHKKVTPKWASSMTDTIIVNNHTFGYLPEYDGFKKNANITNTKTKNKTQSNSSDSNVYMVKQGDKNVLQIAKNLISSKIVKNMSVKDLTNKIVSMNSLKKDKKGNPIIHIGDKLTIPKS